MKVLLRICPKCWVLLFFTYLCVLCATEEMPFWKLIADISLLIQLIPALGCSFSVYSPQTSLSIESSKAVSFQKMKSLQSIARDTISFLSVESKDIRETAGSIIYSIFRKEVNITNCSIISWEWKFDIEGRKRSYRITELFRLQRTSGGCLRASMDQVAQGYVLSNSVHLCGRSLHSLLCH